MSEFDVFLSYNSSDHAFITALATQLKDRQVEVFLDRWHLIPGQPWPERLRKVLASCKAVAVCVGPHEMGPWQQREMYFALERQSRESGFPVIPVLLPDANPPLDFLSQNMWVDFRGGLDNPMALAILQAAITGKVLDDLQAARVQEITHDICPYRGLEFFREQDASFFFGRDTAIQALEDKLRQHSFVALVGASGAGKSSVVRAGLLPSLRKDTEHPWEIVTIVPGDRPLHNLAAAFLPLLEPSLGENDLLIETSKQAKSFLAGELEIRNVVERILDKQSGTERFLLVVDQWEELYTLAKTDKDITALPSGKSTDTAVKLNQTKLFIDGLLDACQAGKLHVVMTLRGDFVGEAIKYRRLSDSLNGVQVNLSAMTPQELQQAIEQPAQKLNVGFDPGLIELLLTDVGEEPGNLPLLEFVLKRLWKDPQRHGQLRLSAYKTMGRLKGALQQEADTLYDNLPSDNDRQQLRCLLLQLVVSNDDNQYTRRRAHQDNLQEFTALIERLTKARLLVSNRDEQSKRSTLEVAHEALITDWPKLRDWLKESRDFLAWRKRLNNAIDDYDSHHDPQALLKGQHLQDAKLWRKRKAKELNPQEVRFIQKSQNQLWWAVGRNSLLMLLPVVTISGFFGWASLNDLRPGMAKDVLLAKYFHYVRAPDMVEIPPKEDCQAANPCDFLMGSKGGDKLEEQPQHKVSFTKRFKMGRHEVTFDEYRVFAHLKGEEQGDCQLVDDEGKSNRHEIPRPNDNAWGFEKRPAIFVSWEDAQCYVQWLNAMIKPGGFRLPSEAEWEYAARAGTQTAYYWGDSEKEADSFAWFNNNSGGKTHPVGEKKPNVFGLYDLSGNVWEWVQDCWHDNYVQAPGDGSAWQEQNNGDCNRRVLRGGSWNNRRDALRSAYRNGYNPDYRIYFIGFRLAQDLP